MRTCPYCNSENTYYSKKRGVWVCEDCDKTFTEADVLKKDPTTSGEGLRLFFSYGHDRNRILVDRIKKDLEARGHHVWIDTDKIRPGDHWREDIVNGVLNSSKIIAFLSEHSTRRPGVCLDELKIAVCVKGANIKTVLLESENRIQPPSTISDIQWLDMSEWYDKKTSHAMDYEDWYHKKFDELCEVIESDVSKELNGEVHMLKEKLHPNLNTDKEHEILSKEFYGRQWLSDYIENWQDKTPLKSLVIYGKPGSGKSAFCVNYSHYNSDVYGCFLCEWNRNETIDPCGLIRTMAFRLATKLSDYRQLLLHLLDEQDCHLDEMKAEELFEFLLAFPLNNLVDGGRETGIIIVDGLDEAETDGKNLLAEIFSMCIQKLPRWIKFIFTSRPEKSVSVHFQSSQSVDLIDNMPSGYNDILNYLLNALKTELFQVPNKLEILDKICKHSEGVFLYAVFLVEEIRNKTIGLQDVDSFPKGLNGFYLNSMKRKFDSDTYKSMRTFVEILCVADTVPEYLIQRICGYTQYKYYESLDRIGSWVVLTDTAGLPSVGFCHKSLKDWFTNPAQSGTYFVDCKHGALELARYCRKHLDEEYASNHVGGFYVTSESYDEFEGFLLEQKEDLYPYWTMWRYFPTDWSHSTLLDAFWSSSKRDEFLLRLQREGDTEFILWVFDKAKERYGMESFDRKLISVYIDIVHLSGKYPEAVEIINNYLGNFTQEEISSDRFLSMLQVRKIHHQMYYTPVERLLNDAIALHATMDKRFPDVYNELLFLIGGNLGVLAGNWELAQEWLEKSDKYADENHHSDIFKRDCRKMSDCFCFADRLEEAKELLLKYVSETGDITGRYEAYLVGALGNIYTCMSYEDEALECYKNLLSYTTSRGIVSWSAHANLGIANVYFKLSNIREAVEYATRASQIYKRIQEEWGIIMSEALLSACQSKLGTAPLFKACDKSIRRARRMQYNACVSSIEDLCSGKRNFLKLYFL